MPRTPRINLAKAVTTIINTPPIRTPELYEASR